MSAIWGAISLGNKRIGDYEINCFHNCYKDCKTDDYKYISFSSGVMGCELQYFTLEDKNSVLPMCDKDEIYYTADVCLDNRDELLGDKLFKDDDKSFLSDGDILFRYYKEYGEKGIKKVYGSYSFVYYNEKSKTVDIVTDHTANRCLYYSIVDGTVYFSTLLNPIFELNKEVMNLDEKTLVDFLAGDDYMVYSDYEATVVKEIKHAVAGEIIRINKNSINHIEYWNPIVLANSLKGLADEEYKKLINDCFLKCVSESIRTDGEVGILQSSGLDSTSVSCFASELLKKRGKKIHAYTMIPKKGYVFDLDENVEVDESKLVHEIAIFLGNVIEHYESYDEMSAWNILEEQLELLEGPFKSLQNVMWLKRLEEMSTAENCKIMLSGGFGNDTISYGNREDWLYSMAIHFKFISLWKELCSHSKYFKYNKKKMIKVILDRFFDINGGKYISKKEFENNSLINKEKLDEYEVYKRFKKRNKSLTKIKTREQYMPIMLDKMKFRQIGDNETKKSLKTGVLCKDPTKNPRLIELCLSFPAEQFNKGCNPRRIVYEYFFDRLPEKILNPKLLRGRQSADFYYRMANSWSDIYTGLYGIFEGKNDLVDSEKIRSFMQENKEKICSGQFGDKKKIEWLLFAKEVVLLQERYKNTKTINYDRI